MNTLAHLRKHLVNIPGWRTKKKIVVIESDDWGSISMPSVQVYNKLLQQGAPIDKSFFAKFDNLECEKDLIELFNVLLSFKDLNGNHPVITANTIVANPAFEKIKESGFNEFFYEQFSETLKKYYPESDVFSKYKTGISSHVFYPQFHGREHLNPLEWFKSIKSGNKYELMAFDHHALLALTKPLVSERKMGYMAAFDYESEEEFDTFKNVILEGQNLFEKLFGFRSSSFVAPTSIRSDRLDSILKSCGIKYHQMGQQFMPAMEGYGKKERFWGQTNKYGQLYWRRNAKFEPSSNQDFDWINSVMFEISTAFKWGKPAVINSHRVNYIGSLVPENREKTLKKLSELLKHLLKKFPDVEFMSSDQLGDLIASTKSIK